MPVGLRAIISPNSPSPKGSCATCEVGVKAISETSQARNFRPWMKNPVCPLPQLPNSYLSPSLQGRKPFKNGFGLRYHCRSLTRKKPGWVA